MSEANNNLNDDKSEISAKKDVYQKLQALGLEYIHRQRMIVIFPIVFATLTLIIQLLNIIFILGLGGLNPRPPPGEPNLPGQPQPLPLFDKLTPAIIFLIFAIFIIIKVVFFIRLQQSVKNYSESTDSLRIIRDVGEPDAVLFPKEPTMVSIFYEILDHMNLIRKLSVCLYLIFFIYSQWYFRYFLAILGIIPGSPDSAENIMHILNLINQVGMIFYLIMDLNQFIHWTKKLNRIQNFERKISEEFGEIEESEKS
jgi:hypothetical protein